MMSVLLLLVILVLLLRRSRTAVADNTLVGRVHRAVDHAERRARAILLRQHRALKRGHARVARKLARRYAIERAKLNALTSLRVDHTEPAYASESMVARTIFSSLTLRQAFRICSASADEAMVFVVGIETARGTRYGLSVVQVGHTSQSPVSAEAAMVDSHRLSIRAHEAKHPIVAILHTHPGRGAGATTPSAIDLRTHTAWEQAWPLVGGIFSRDGYLRFFSAGTPFEVEVCGNHMERVGDGLYKFA